MSRRQLRVRVREHRSRRSEAEPEPAEQTLALVDAEVDGEPTLKERGEGLAVPEIVREASLLRSLTESTLDRLQLGLCKTTGATRMRPLDRARQPLFVKLTDPILGAPGGITQ